MMDFVSISILRCSGEGYASSLQLRKRDSNEVESILGAGGEVVRIRYPEHGQVSSVSECNPTSSETRECLVLNTKLLVTIVGGAASAQVHQDILMILKDAFKVNIFVKFLPELVDASYLGPDPGAIKAPLLGTNTEEPTQEPEHHYASRTAGLVISASFAILLMKALACAAYPKASKLAALPPCQKVSSLFRRRKQSDGPLLSENDTGPTPPEGQTAEDDCNPFTIDDETRQHLVN
mmetsp:Transcript_25741/g.43934  ORF Transcript_25741/g.43934 Transcript_25741/m.43934 type:complete len:236 (+) Transcript_25741:1-708(+)